MGTTDNFDSPSSGDFALSDTFPIKDATTSRAATASGEFLLSGLCGVVASTSTQITVTRALHGNRTLVVSAAAPCAVTLPQALGTGAVYRITLAVAATGTQHTIKVANATDIMRGIVLAVTTTSDNVEGFKTTATSDTLTLNGTTTGGVVGDTYDIQDVATGIFSVRGFTAPTGAEATPFSAAVP